MTNDNRVALATEEEVRRLVEGKQYEAHVGSWIQSDKHGDVFFVTRISLSYGNRQGHQLEMALLTARELIEAINLRDEEALDDVLSGNNFTADVVKIDDAGIHLASDSGAPELFTKVSPPQGLGRVGLTEGQRTMLQANILGTFVPPEETDDPAFKYLVVGIAITGCEGRRLTLGSHCALNVLGPNSFDLSGPIVLDHTDDGAPSSLTTPERPSAQIVQLRPRTPKSE